MERLTKLIVIASNLLALWLQADLVSRGFPPILVPTITAFILACSFSFILGEVVVSIVMAAIYCVPAILFARMGAFSYSFTAIWLAALCGGMLPQSARSSWAFPANWKSPLAFWSLAIALAWPIIVLREVDFYPPLMDYGRLGNSRLGVTPAFVTVWIVSVSTIAMTGLLLLDWLFLTYPRERLKQFEWRIIWPLFGGMIVAATVAVYQSFVDLSFLNRTLFGSIGRAVGTTRDANVFGTAAAMWLPITAAVAITRPSKSMWFTVFSLACCAALAIGVWASGSRTALLAAACGLLVAFAYSWRRLTLRNAALGLAALVAAGVAMIFVGPKLTTSGPLARLFTFVTTPDVPELSVHGVMYALHQLWARGMYGTASVRMIADHPFVGVGIGGFNYQYADALYLIDRTLILPPDNAQNWFRQQLAEMGVLGSLGWIVWMAVFLRMLLRRHGAPDRRPLVGATKGAIVGLVMASLLGMPTLDFIPSITFIVLACWCLKLISNGDAPIVQSRTRGRIEWSILTMSLLMFLGATTYTAATDLRPPYRALRADFPYRYGFSAPDARNPEFRWTAGKAVDVFHANKRWLKIVIGAAAPDADQRPVRVSMWFNKQLILRVYRRSTFPITKYIKLPNDQAPIMIEIHVSRTWRPADFGMGSDRQERGVAVAEWVFVDDDPPKGSLTVE